MAMGDANNDIEMLQFAGLGIAMGVLVIISSLPMMLQPATMKTVSRAIEVYFIKRKANRQKLPLFAFLLLNQISNQL